jgi:hypothetical protein
MPKYNEKTKASIYKWRQTHKDQYNEYLASAMRVYNEKNREKNKNKKFFHTIDLYFG